MPRVECGEPGQAELFKLRSSYPILRGVTSNPVRKFQLSIACSSLLNIASFVDLTGQVPCGNFIVELRCMHNSI
jgi:hypothetical protein